MNRTLRIVYITGVVLYWPTIFILTHLTHVPAWIARAQMSDKAMHYIGYFTLMYLLWFAFFPTRKFSPAQKAGWLAIAILAVYGAVDEWLQAFVHRTPDIHDWLADMAGVFTAAIILAFAPFRAATLMVTAIITFVLTVLAKTDVLAFVPALDSAFYFAAYAFIAFLTAGLGLPARSRIVRFFVTICVPATLLIIAIIAANWVHKEFELSRVAAAIAGILTSAAMIALGAINSACIRTQK
jgi:hypothetical protein